MSWTIYKPGQGYWTRLLSGLAGGVLVVGAARWSWNIIGAYSFEHRIYFQAAVAVAIIAVFGLMLFKWVAVKPRTTDFLIATEGEMKKVNWPNKRELVGSTWIVIVALFMFAAILFFADYVFLQFFRAVGVLKI